MTDCFRYLRLLSFVLLLPLAACSMQMAKDNFPPIIFDAASPVALDVARVDVVEKFTPPLTPPHVEHLAPVPPAHAMRNWARDRLQAKGSGGAARFTIVDASVTEQKLKKKEGLSGLVTSDQEVRYTVLLKARVDVDAPTGQGFAEASVSRERTVPEGLSVAEREQILHTLITATAMDLDRQLERNVRGHLKAFLLN